ncbi:hypothetical protein GGU10DRAFT_335696 [Lentinula aff. detonsa]|uniref:Uncharacterized protein n=1 Tax=Lentinula aff. detonsa TaxID=2804958 RepID=A0AA38NNZ6_9AGAR|nr:hypothetical protein GGU10DRAFT_335696 [Lentinula aff. detonsa]
MTDRLNFDPSNIPLPDFSSNTYVTIHRALIADKESPGITSEAKARQHLQDQWEEENGALCAQYVAQIEEGQALAEARNKEAAEEQHLKDAERKAKEDGLAKKAEEKRTPLYSFKQGVGVRHIRQQIHPYAKKLMTARKLVPLWYFLPKATAEVKERNKEAIDTNRFQPSMDETDSSNSSLTLVGLHTVRASLNAVPDS